MLRMVTKKYRSNIADRSGVTLIEIMIVSVIIAMLAAVSFPVYKIIQQREKERRLKEILYSVRAAIGGCKSQRSNKIFTEGFRNYVYSKGQELIEASAADKAALKAAMKEFTLDGTQNGKFYPASPSLIIANMNYTVRIATGTVPATEYVDVKIQRRFLRNIPPHPFTSWYPNAHWEFKPVSPAGAPTASAAGDIWNTGAAYGVKNIVSRGAGLGLDGSNTDAW